MTDTTTRSNRLVVILGLTIALGPLTALSFGSKFADEETLARAHAGLQNAKPADVLGKYGDVDAVPSYASSKTLADVLSGSGVFDEFRAAIQNTDKADLLSGAGTYTLFVPSDEAFAKLSDEQRAALRNDPEALASLISKHIVPGRYSATDLMQMREARTLDGSSIAVGPAASYDGHIGFGSSDVVNSNIHAANGIVHVIDRVNL
ncbi:MAG: fasciclin domain-containing protein [Lamprobacter sp.]|uniref:fasciclin domain-containing protein n=1 Tax=Lamprobacter sp. TaxID=3100796 RepID=UPI002B25B8A0|nr:fasciclin domain-containing protein [Lamprobacter sp.]MEA3640932.1 fasciclin domain-containing protein [Lamprobacter sp.]